MKVNSRFSDLSEIKNLFPKDFSVVGVGVTGFPRSALGYLLPNYSVLSLLETDDLSSIREVMEVVSLEEMGAKMPEKYNTSEILQIKEAKEYLKNKQALFLYKASKQSSRLAEGMGLKVLSTAGEVRSVFENKKFFRVEGKKAGINLIPGTTLLVDDLTEEKWQEYRGEWGERLVFQLPDYTVGGGLSTFFVNDREDFLKFKDFVKRRREAREIVTVNVTKFVEGREASMTGCATKHGVVTGALQTQVIDQPELAALQGRSGVWLGHDWYSRFSKQEQLTAEELVRKWGEYVYSQGYRGIFGLDLIIDDEGMVWPVECNARYTGAFPVYSMMQMDRGEMPIDVWHLLEWMGIDYQMDIEEVQREARKPKQGAQLVLHNMERRSVTATKKVRAGVYRVVDLKTKPLHISSLKNTGSLASANDLLRTHSDGSDAIDRRPAHRNSVSFSGKNMDRSTSESDNAKIEYVRPGFSMMDIKDENEVILTDRTPREDWVLGPAERVGRLLFKRPVVDEKGRLLPEIRGVVKAIYDKFEFGLVG